MCVTHDKALIVSDVWYIAKNRPIKIYITLCNVYLSKKVKKAGEENEFSFGSTESEMS